MISRIPSFLFEDYLKTAILTTIKFVLNDLDVWITKWTCKLCYVGILFWKLELEHNIVQLVNKNNMAASIMNP